jgi:outer membrane protein assembly factor BamB
MAFNADTGEVLWEHKYNIFTSDVPPHRIAWASPAVDPATGHIFAFSGNGHLHAFSPTARSSGSARWPRSSACGRPTAAACRRPWWTATSSSSAG